MRSNLPTEDKVNAMNALVWNRGFWSLCSCLLWPGQMIAHMLAFSAAFSNYRFSDTKPFAVVVLLFVSGLIFSITAKNLIQRKGS
jgi:hypothetical protein